MEKAQYPGVDYHDHGNAAGGKILTEDSQKKMKELTKSCREIINEISSGLNECNEKDRLAPLSRQLEDKIIKIEALAEE